VTDPKLNEDVESELAAFEDLPEEEQLEVFWDRICGLPLDFCLEEIVDLDERRKFVGSYAMIKIGTAATEVFESSELVGPEDRAELAIVLLELLTVAAKEAGTHRHKLASGLRGLARTLGS
jgi:hypothetical protein